MIFWKVLVSSELIYKFSTISMIPVRLILMTMQTNYKGFMIKICMKEYLENTESKKKSRDLSVYLNILYSCNDQESLIQSGWKMEQSKVEKYPGVHKYFDIW